MYAPYFKPAMLPEPEIYTLNANENHPKCTKIHAVTQVTFSHCFIC